MLHVWLGLLGCAPTAGETSVLEPPPEDDGFQVNEGSFTLPAYTEGLYCAHFPIPERYGEGPVYVSGVASVLPVMTHHFFMAYDATPTDEVVPCSPEGAFVTDLSASDFESHADFGGKMIFGAGVGAYDYQLPAGYGIELAGGGRLTTNHHVLNTTDDAADLYGAVNIFTAPVAEVHHPVSILNCLLTDIVVPPHTVQTVSATCTVPFDLDLVVVSSHAHQHLTLFEARIFDGKKPAAAPFYTSETWDAPAIEILQEPIALEAGQGITFSCTYDNQTDQNLVYGTGDYGEMCATMNGYAYPADRTDELPPSLGMILPTDGGTAEVIDTTEIDGSF